MKDSKPKANLLIPKNVQAQLVSLYSYAKINKNIAMSCLTEDVCSKYQNVISDNNLPDFVELKNLHFKFYAYSSAGVR